MITPGAAFQIYNPDRGTHPFYIILSIIEESTRVFAVRIKPDEKESDKSCVLKKGEHPFITIDSVIDYGRPITPEIVVLKRLIDSGSDKITFHEPISGEVFKRICNGGLNSDELPLKYLKHIPTLD